MKVTQCDVCSSVDKNHVYSGWRRIAVYIRDSETVSLDVCDACIKSATGSQTSNGDYDGQWLRMLFHRSKLQLESMAKQAGG